MQRKDNIEVPSCIDCQGRKKGQLFCHISIDGLDKISYGKTGNFYKKSQAIFYEGNRGHGLYCIYKGKVKIHKLGLEGKDQIVRFSNKGDILGYRSLLCGDPYNATATALEDCIICYIPKNKILELLDTNIDLSFGLIQLLTKDLKESEKKITNINQKPVVERIAEALLFLKMKFGLKEDGITIDLILTRKEIGDFAGVTVETTIRTLSSMNKQGLIHLNGKEIEILDLPKLTRLAKIVN